MQVASSSSATTPLGGHAPKKMGLLPLEFADCLIDSPYFRENLKSHEKQLDQTSADIKGIIRDIQVRNKEKSMKIFDNHTIRKVKFLSKNSILTKPQHFHEFLTQIFFSNFSREIKVVDS